MKRLLLGLALLLSLAVVTSQQVSLLRDRPTVLKLGPVPHAGLVKALAGEHRVLLAFRSVVRVMFYFGSFFDARPNRLQQTPEYFSMYKHLENAVQVDPYNMDAYYFSQAAFTWELGRAQDVNRMLEYGMRYRTWDYWLPFYAGFNAAYFLKDYDSAARYMQRAAELSGNALFTNLASRYFHESGDIEMGLVFLETMKKGAKNARLKNVYDLRIQALTAVRTIEAALASYIKDNQAKPDSLVPLVAHGYLPAIPSDPYGGEFYLDNTGKVRSTSKFAMQGEVPAHSKASSPGSATR